MSLSMMSVAGAVLEKLTSSFQEVMGRGTNHTSKILSLQSKEVPTDVYWVKVKVLATLILMCDHSPQHTNSNGRNVVYVRSRVLTILDVLKYVTQLWQIPTFVLKQDQRNLTSCVFMMWDMLSFVLSCTTFVITVVIVAVVVPSLCFR